MKKPFNYKPHILLIIPLALSSFLTINQLHNKSFWLDEVFSIYISRDLSYLINSFIHTESNMLLYYMLLHFWLYLGNSEFVVRLLSVFTAVGTVPMIFLLGKKLFNVRVGIIAAFILSVNGFMVEYAQDARAYSLLLFQVTTISYFLLRYLEKQNIRNLLMYFIIGFLAILTHFFAIFIITSHILFLLITNRKSIFSHQFVLTAIPFGILASLILLLPSFHDQGGISWIQKFQFIDLTVLFSHLSGGRHTSKLVFIVFVVFAFILVKKRNLFNTNLLFILISLCTPIILTIFISLLVKPTFVIRYMIICLPFFILLESYILSLIKSKPLLVSLFTVFFVLSLLNVKGIYGAEKENWRDAAEYVASNYRQNDIIVFHPYFARIPFEFYLHKYPKTFTMPELTEFEYRKGGGRNLPEPNLSLINNTDAKRIWFIIRTDQTPHREEQKKIITDTIDKRFKLDQEKNYKMIKIDLYK